MTTKLCVLLVEDSEDDASLILRELKKGGYAVEHRRVFSRDAMAAALDEKTWDLVLADHNMPSFNSMDALALVRERKLDTPFIIVSGAIGEETAVAAMKAGAHDFVMKGKLARLVPAIGRELREAVNRRMRASAEEQAKKESMRAQHYLDIAGTMLLALDARGTVTMINRKGCEILGRPEREIVGKNWFDNFIPPGVREEIRSMFPKYLAEGGPKQWENTVLTAKGEERIITWHNVTIRNGHGKAVGTLSSGEDLTERKLAEANLQKSEEKYHALVDTMTDVIFTLDFEGNVIDIAPSIKKLIGYSSEEITGKEFAGFLHPDDLPKAQNEFLNAIQGKGHPIEIRVNHADGTPRWISINALLIMRDGEPDNLLCVLTDIHEKKVAEEALQESEERFKRLTGLSFEGIGIIVDGKVADANPCAGAMLGYDPGEFSGRPLMELIAPASREAVMERMRSGSDGPSEHLALRKDGSTFPVEVRGGPIRYKGRPGRVVSMRDVTERKRAEEALLVKNFVFDASISANSIANIDGVITEANSAFLRLWGFTSKEEVVGRPILDFFYNKEEAVAIITALNSTGAWDGDFTGMRKNGSTFLAHGLATVIKDESGKVIGYQSSVNDITERKKANAELRESEERFRALFEQAAVGIAQVAPDGRWLNVNQRWCDILGYTREELLTKSFLDITHPDDVDNNVANQRKLLNNEIHTYSTDKRYIGKDMSVVWVNLTVSLLRDAAGAPKYFISVIEDITKRKAAEEALQKSEKRYRELVDNLSEVVVEADIEGNISYVSRQSEQLYGFKPEEITGRNVAELIHPDDRRAAMEALIRVGSGDPNFDFEFRTVHKDGHFVPSSASGRMVQEGDDFRIVGILKDITERKKAAERIDHLASFPGLNPSPVLELDPAGKVTYLNPAAENVMIGAGLADASGLLPADLPSLLQELAKQPESIVHREVAAGNRMFHQTISMPRGIQNIRIYSVDVTEVKRAEEALKKSEQQFRLLAENARDLVYRVRLQPTPAVEYISPSALALTGHSPEEFLADPALAARILPPEAREAQEMNPKMKGNMGGPVTMSWPRPDGATAWLEMVSHPVLNAAGKLVAVEGVGRDITERKQVEDALRESEEKFRNLAEHSPNMIFIHVKGRVVYANHRWEEVMGYTREEFCSPGFDFISVVIAPEYRDAMREKYRKHLSNQDLTPDEHAVIAKDGRRIPVILSTTLIRYGGEMAILGTLTDITELKRSEEKLARLNQQNELVLCSAAEGILGLDLQNDQTFVNPAAARMLGYEVEELLGRHSHSTWHHSKPDGSPYPQEECLINATFLDGAVHRSSTEVFWRKDGTSFPVEYASTPIYEKGRVAGAVVTFADITERKLAEEKIRASLKEKEVLLKEIHHRVKNNLQIISSLLSMQSRRVKDAHILEVLRESQNRVQTMALIHDRIYRSADLSRVDLREYITRLVNELYISYGVDPARVRLDLDLEEVQMEIETAIPCGFIINELVSNCLKHAFHSRKRGALRISLSSGDGGAVRLSVSDDGVGLPRGFDFTKTESLGLQLVCGLVTQLRGTIELGKDAGTEFRIEFRLGEP